MRSWLRIGCLSMIPFLSGVFAVLCSVGVGHADGLYCFRDERGVMHFTNVPTDSRYKLIARYKNITVRGAMVSSVSRSRISLASLNGVISSAARSHNLDPALIKAVIKAESGGLADARSQKGAIGLMQLMPDTAAELYVANPFDPELNIWGGAKYLRQMIDRFGGNIRLALAAYNAGPASVERFGGVPPFRETREYVDKVLALWRGMQ
ncbi:MAG: transglycosylase SLT domain-containing protein [Dissulfurimicrobium sp.]|uniref:transglycosylase SLT domain-containing protein n=1 Tax=Dissulfurimicrobium TaxID=1769732 RepID=UPI001EDC7599|nr:transglycosylase SLT domain-containing protein [Dissulfurimicrobium hydrothermale]UKL14225.1 lytic transglycosylase domain-containing protein [Dissulfurimicrobium hydrothermale]